MSKEERTFGTHVVQYSPQYSLCAGCTTCEIVCSLTHDGVVGPRHNRIFLKRGTSSMIHQVLACMHCDDHPCYQACPLQDKAMCLDEQLNIAYINEQFCIGCGACMKHCVFTPSRINLVKSKDKKQRKAKKCDLCRTRMEGPACIEWCPVRCIGSSDVPCPEPESPPAAGAPVSEAPTAGAPAAKTPAIDGGGA